LSVLKRNRSMSPLEFLNLAIKIRANIINLVMNEKYVAKRWRPVITFPMCNMAHGLIKNIRTANSIIPFRNSENKYNTQEANERLHYQDLSIADCEQMLDMLQFMIDEKPALITKLSAFSEDIIKEIALLRGWRLSDIKRFNS